MPKEQYCFKIGKGGQKSLQILDYCFNPTTQKFLLANGLKPRLKILDIGCGSGIMSCWLAKQTGKNGSVVAIDSDSNQLQTAIKLATKQKLTNITFRNHSIYKLPELKLKFDLIYCRFLLHHLDKPDLAIAILKKCLKKNGLLILEEGIMNAGFAYPETAAFKTPNEQFIPGKPDKNIGRKLYYKLSQLGFKIIKTELVQPLLLSKQEKSLLLPGLIESKEYYLATGKTEQDWQQLYKQTIKLINNPKQIVGFYQSCQICAKKP